MARAALELGLREVASALGMSTATITRFEKGGDTRVSTLDALTKSQAIYAAKNYNTKMKFFVGRLHSYINIIPAQIKLK